MNTPDNIPWYRGAVLQGILASLCAQAISHSNLAAVITGDQALGLVNYALDAISAAALAYAAHGRIAKPLPAVHLTKAGADAANLLSSPEGKSNAQVNPDPADPDPADSVPRP